MLSGNQAQGKLVSEKVGACQLIQRPGMTASYGLRPVDLLFLLSSYVIYTVLGF